MPSQPSVLEESPGLLRQGESPPVSPPPSGEEVTEYFLDLIVDTLQQMDPGVQGAFLQKLFKSLAGVDVSEKDSLFHWQEILRRRSELSERLSRPVSLRTAAVDYFGTGMLLRNPILLEYGELKRLRHNAATDPLTGLYNRRLFDEYLSRELNRSRRYRYPLGLLLFDLRNFKNANDSYGHAAGDQVLCQVARACVETVRGSDYPCRIGGDEFAIVLPQSDRQSAHALAQRISERFDEYVQSLRPDVGLGLDYGVAGFPEDGDTSASLFQAGDRDLYRRKREAHKNGSSLTEPGAASPTIPLLEPAQALRQMAAVSSPSQQRRYERISLEGTDAYGVLRADSGSKVVRVLDLSFGGVSFLVDEPAELPETFYARLHVPILPSAEVKVRRVYSHRLGPGVQRVGCCFTS